MSTMQAGTIIEGRYHLRSEGVAQDLGMLYHAHDVQEDRPVDILVLPRPARASSHLLADLKSAQRAVTDLGQPALTPYEQVGAFGGNLYLVRQHLAGYSLAQLLANSGPLQAPAAVEITTRLCQALAPAHRAGLVHGSLAPDCLFILEGIASDEEPGLAVAISDFGLFPALRPAVAVPGRPWGRKPYLTPEQAAGSRIQPAADVYVIGCLIYLMLTGRPPFRADDESVLAAQHLRQDPPSLQILVPGLPEPLVQIVQKALAKEPAMRYRNAGQLAHILRTKLGQRPQGQVVPPAPGQAQPASQGSYPLARVARPESIGPGPAAFPVQPTASDRLVVPPPPRRPAIERAYEFVEDEPWVEEPEGVDWLMLGLFVVALAAVLGLIPLWRTVYRRYSAPPSVPPPASVAPLPADMALSISALDPLRQPARQPTRRAVWRVPAPITGPEFEDPELFCYNIRLASLSVIAMEQSAS